MWEPLTAPERERFIKKEFSVDALHMELIKRSKDSDFTITGVGTIEQSPSGRFQFVVICKNAKSINPTEFHRPSVTGPIEEQEMFDLRATDTRGRTWIATHLIIRYLFELTETNEGIVVRCSTSRIRSKSSTDENRNDALGLFFPRDFPIPATETVSETLKEAGEKKRERLTASKLAKFRHKGAKFRLDRREEQDGVEVTVIADQDTSFPPGFDSRVEEALWLVCGRIARWSLLYRRRNGVQEVILEEPRMPESRPRFPPPVNLLEHPDDALQLFRRYLDHVVKYREPEYHPTSVSVLRVLRASSLTLDAEARELSIEIEGVVNREFAQKAEPSPEELSDIELAEDYFSEWDPSDEANEPDRICDRVLGLLNILRAPHARNGLENLKSEGILTETQVQVWNKLRNPAAHGETLKWDPEKLMEKCDRLYQLFIFLLFYKVSYSGPFTDPTALDPDQQTKTFPLD